jgi:hypothetical protein
LADAGGGAGDEGDFLVEAKGIEDWRCGDHRPPTIARADGAGNAAGRGRRRRVSRKYFRNDEAFLGSVARTVYPQFATNLAASQILSDGEIALTRCKP